MTRNLLPETPLSPPETPYREIQDEAAIHEVIGLTLSTKGLKEE